MTPSKKALSVGHDLQTLAFLNQVDWERVGVGGGGGGNYDRGIGLSFIVQVSTCVASILPSIIVHNKQF